MKPSPDPTQLQADNVALVGIPWDANSSHRRGAAAGPTRIRAALNSGASNLCTESGLDLDRDKRFADRGDMKTTAGGTQTAEDIESSAAHLLENGSRILALGGDHAVSYPLAKACQAKFGPLQILHLDAHPDLYDAFEGNRLSHASPFARIMEGGLCNHLVQVGIRADTTHQRDQARRFGVETVDMRRWAAGLELSLEPPLYLSIDLDVLDPAFAPGVSHPEPGGLSTRELIGLVQSIRAPLAGADIVELNPSRDVNGLTAVVAAKLVREIAAVMLANGPPEGLDGPAV